MAEIHCSGAHCNVSAFGLGCWAASPPNPKACLRAFASEYHRSRMALSLATLRIACSFLRKSESIFIHVQATLIDDFLLLD